MAENLEREIEEMCHFTFRMHGYDECPECKKILRPKWSD